MKEPAWNPGPDTAEKIENAILDNTYTEEGKTNVALWQDGTEAVARAVWQESPGPRALEIIDMILDEAPHGPLPGTLCADAEEFLHSLRKETTCACCGVSVREVKGKPLRYVYCTECYEPICHECVGREPLSPLLCVVCEETAIARGDFPRIADLSGAALDRVGAEVKA